MDKKEFLIGLTECIIVLIWAIVITSFLAILGCLK